MKQSEWALRLTLLVNITLCAIVFQQWIAVAALLLLLLSSALPLRVEVDRIGQIIIALVCLGGTYTLTVLVGPPPKHPISQAFALVQAFVCVWSCLYAIARLFLSNPLIGRQGTLLFALLAVFACGGNKIGWTYHAFVDVFTLLAMWALASSDPSRPTLQRSTSRRKLLLSGAVASSAVIAMCFFVLLPYAYQKVTSRLRMSMLSRTQTGFDLYFRLGSLQHMLESRRVVLRVRGPRLLSMHLRGVVYDRYNNKHWRASDSKPIRRIRVPRRLTRPKRRWTVEYVAGEATRYFLPLSSSHLATPTGRVRMDPMGIVKPEPEETPDTISFASSQSLWLKVKKPQRTDLQLHSRLRVTLRAVAKKWTKGAHTNLQKLRAIQKHLRTRYTYSLSFSRLKDREPILDFLLYNKQGHCEYFASSMALLARSLGIPARVVGGYLVSEYNPLGNYFIVREQNAHTWVEGWVQGRGWRTFDPTPPGGTNSHMPKEAGFLTGAVDLLRVWFHDFRVWVAGLTVKQISGVLALFVLIWLAIRLQRLWRARNHDASPLSIDYRDPLPSFLALESALEKIAAKRKSETLESYAVRLMDQKLPEAARRASPLISAYASLRYGKVGNAEDLVEQIQEWLELYAQA